MKLRVPHLVGLGPREAEGAAARKLFRGTPEIRNFACFFGWFRAHVKLINTSKLLVYRQPPQPRLARPAILPTAARARLLPSNSAHRRLLPQRPHTTGQRACRRCRCGGRQKPPPVRPRSDRDRAISSLQAAAKRALKHAPFAAACTRLRPRRRPSKCADEAGANG